MSDTPTFEERLKAVMAEKLAGQEQEEFWLSRDYLKHVRDAAHARQRSALGVLGVVLTRVAAMLNHNLRVPPIVGADAGLGLITVILAPPGIGKSSTNHAGAALLPAPADLNIADQLPLGSGEGMVEVFFGTVEETDEETGKQVKVRKQIRHNAFFYVDEGQVIGEIGNRRGATLLPTIRSAFTGAVLGQMNASEERRRILPAGTYSIGITIAMQTVLADALLNDAAGGTPQRLLWLPATDRTIPADPPPWPGRLPWQPPTYEALRMLRIRTGDMWWSVTGNEAFIGVAEPIQAEIRAADYRRVTGQVTPDVLDAHADLLRLKVAVLLAALDGRLDVDEEDWRLATAVKRMSDATRDSVVAAVATHEAERELAASTRLARRAAHADAAVTQRRIIDCARKLAAKVWADPDRWTRIELYRALRRWRDVLDDGLEHAAAEGWVTEVVESGQGEDKRSIRPGSRRPS